MKNLPKRRLLIQGRCEDCMLGKQPPRPCSSSGLDMLTMNRAPSRWHPSLPAVQLNCSVRKTEQPGAQKRQAKHAPQGNHQPDGGMITHVGLPR